MENRWRYKKSGGFIPVDKDIPEADVVNSTSDEVYGMNSMTSIIGHGCSIQTPDEDEIKTVLVCEREYRHLKLGVMAKYINKWEGESCKWVFTNTDETEVEPVVAPNQYLIKTSMMYVKNGPLMVYTNIPTLEVRFQASDNAFWKALHAHQEPISCTYTTAGLIEGNCLVSMELFTGNDDNYTPEQQKCLQSGTTAPSSTRITLHSPSRRVGSGPWWPA